MKDFLKITFTFFSLTVFGQQKINGTYDKESKTFIATNGTYWIDGFENGIARISKNGKFGLMDSTGLILCETVYDKIFDFNEENATPVCNFLDSYEFNSVTSAYNFSVDFKGAAKYGILNKNGQTTLNPSLSFISSFSFGIALYKNQYDGKYGLVDESGKLLTKPIYDSVSRFKEGLARFLRGDVFGVIDGNGTELKTISKTDMGEWEWAENIESHRYRVLSDEVYYVYPLQYSDSLAPVSVLIKERKKYGFIDRGGGIIIPAQYDLVSNFKNGYAKVKLNGKWGIINKLGKFVFSAKYSNIRMVDAHRFLVKENGKWSVIDKAGKKLLTGACTEMVYLFGDLFAVQKGVKIKKQNVSAPLINFLWGVVNISNKVIVEAQYKDLKCKENLIVGISRVSYGFPEDNSMDPGYGPISITDFAGYLKSRNGLDKININVPPNDLRIPAGSFLVPAYAHDAAILDYRNSLLAVRNISGDTVMYVDKNVVPQLKVKYDFSDNIENGIAIVGKNDTANKKLKFGIIDRKGKEIVAPVYDGIGSYSTFEYNSAPTTSFRPEYFYSGKFVGRFNNFILVRQGDKYGIINNKNDVIVPVDFDWIEFKSFGADLYSVVDGRIKLQKSVDLSGKTIDVRDKK